MLLVFSFIFIITYPTPTFYFGLFFLLVSDMVHVSHITFTQDKMIIERGPYSRYYHYLNLELDYNEILEIHVAQSGVKINKKPASYLEIHLKNGDKYGITDNYLHTEAIEIAKIMNFEINQRNRFNF